MIISEALKKFIEVTYFLTTIVVIARTSESLSAPIQSIAIVCNFF